MEEVAIPADLPESWDMTLKEVIRYAPLTLTLTTTLNARLQGDPFKGLPFLFCGVFASLICAWRRQPKKARRLSVVVASLLLGSISCGGIDDTLENLRMTTQNLSDLTDSLKQRPWSLIRIKQPEDRKIPH